MAELPGVLILYNLPRALSAGGAGASPDTASTKWSESDSGVLAEVEAVRAALAKLGVAYRIAGVRSLAELPAALGSGQEKVVFNLVESLEGATGDFNLVPAVCRSFGRACTGSDSAALSLSLDKWQTKSLLAGAGLDVPRGLLVAVGKKPPTRLFAGPYIVKPVAADASEGITAASVVAKAGAALAKAVATVHAMGQPAIIEQFVDGRELNVSVVQRGQELQVLPLAEIDLSGLPAGSPRIVDYAAKWLPDSEAYQNTPRVIPAPLKAGLAKQVRALALAAWRALGCQDYARVDFRLDSRSRPMILELNANPDITPDDGFTAALAAGGIKFEEFVAMVIDNAATRLAGQSAPTPATLANSAVRADAGVSVPAAAGPCAIRHTQSSDRGEILGMLERTGFFRPDELEVAREVLDEALAKGADGHYLSYAVAEGDKPLGWVCIGPTPCCLGTYDLYWIVVGPEQQSRGLGKLLVAHAEKVARSRQGRIMVIETSGRDVYLPTRRFYLRTGYHETARIPDFYGPGDDKVVYIKFLQDYPPRA